MIFMIDNYDSFTYNLVQYFGELGCQIKVLRNDQTSVEEIETLNPSHIVISPGPGTPDQAGISKAVIQTLGPRFPILGVCLGHQCIGEVYGGKVERAPRLMHGKISPVYHQGDVLFQDLPTPFEATRYHSLIVNQNIPDPLTITASTAEGEVMAIRHKTYPVFGVQFHPESILTQGGKQILQNFLNYS